MKKVTFVGFGTILLCAAVMFTLRDASALMEELSLEFLVNKASKIVVGQVTSVESWQTTDGNFIYTDVTVVVSQDVKGISYDKRVTLTIPGGVVGNRLIWVEDVPTFQVGENVLVYLGPEHDGILGVVGLFQGKVSLGFGPPDKGPKRARGLVRTIADIMAGRSPNSDSRRGKIAVGGVPVINSITPSITTAGTGAVITISGSNFTGNDEGGRAVLFTGVGEPVEIQFDSPGGPNGFISWSDTQIKMEIRNNKNNTWAPSNWLSNETSSGPVKVRKYDVDGEPSTSNGYAIQIRYSWSNCEWSDGSNVPTYYNLGGNINKESNESLPQVDTALDNARSTWNGISGANLTINQAGYNSNSIYNTMTSGFFYNDGQSVLFWNPNVPAGTIAQTRLDANYTTGIIDEADIVFNNSKKWSAADPCSSYSYDIWDVAAHELGHLIGLYHLYGTADAQKTMYGYLSTQETLKRTLTSDDKAGAIFIYPSGGKVVANITGSVPEGFSLDQNYPNPFNPQTSIVFTLLKASPVEFTIYNATGQVVRTLVAGNQMTQGAHTLVWDGKDDKGQKVASGLYLYRLIAGDFIAAKKMLLLR